MRSTAPCFLARDRRRRCCSWLFLRRMRKAIFPHVPCGFSPPMVFFSHRYYSEFGVDLEQFDIFLSNRSCGIASAKRLSQSWQAGSATTRVFFLLSFRRFRVYGTLRQCMFHRVFGYTTRATREPPLAVGSCGKKQDAMEPLALSVHGFRHVLCSAGFGAARVRQK